MKKLLFLLVGFVGFVGFGYCQVSFSSTSSRTRAGSEINLFISSGQLICFTRNNTNLNQCQVNGTSINNTSSACIYNNGDSDLLINASCNGMSSSRTLDYWILNGDSAVCSSFSCDYSGYILESEIDSGYCMSNNLCPESTGLNRSELKINDIVHQSAPFINITIPQEFDWDYTVDENEFDLSISGYNVDTDYIDGIITAQTVKPNSSDLNKIISDLIPLFVPGLVVILFIWFVFRFIKKVF